MGLRCLCGVSTNPIAVDPEILLTFAGFENRSGTLTFTIDVCSDTPESSTFTATFVDQSGPIQNRSFVFTSTNISEIICQVVGGQCNVVILGMGLVAGELSPRPFTFSVVDEPSPLSDRLNVFAIDGFVTSSETIGQLQPDLTFLGCPTTP
jgi:hypothetical protein